MNSRLAVWAGPLLLLATGAAMMAWTWGSWLDPIVDFGRELYVPWRLNAGERLYTDIAWFNGPLSQHWNALWFWAFGVGLSTIVAANTAVLVGTVAMLYLLFVRLSDRLTATVAGLVFLTVFAFGQYTTTANYNWLCPYSHELTHGVALSIAVLFALDRWHTQQKLPALLLAGLFLGLAFLTKPESFGAALTAAGTFLLVTRAANVRALALFAGSALLPVVISVLLVGLRGTLGAWPSILGSEVSELAFYRAGMGLDRPAQRSLEILRWAGAWTLTLLPSLVGAWLLRGKKNTPLLAVLVGAQLAVLWFAFPRAPWLQALRPLPLFALILAGFLLLGVKRDARRWAPGLAFTALALVTLAKMILFTRVYTYGFALALPATLLVVVALVGWLPRWLDARGAWGGLVRFSVVGLLATGVVMHLRVTERALAGKTVTVGTGVDAFRADPRGRLVNDALAFLGESKPRTLAVVPEGITLNYLARVPTSTPYINFMPPEEILFGDEAWARAFADAPPDMIVIVPKDTAEYGRGQFGEGYGQKLRGWIESAYQQFGSLKRERVPLEMHVLRRKEDV